MLTIGEGGAQRSDVPFVLVELFLKFGDLRAELVGFEVFGTEMFP